MFRHLQCNILIVDYRGFGMSEGEPSEQGLKWDAEVMVIYDHHRQLQHHHHRISDKLSSHVRVCESRLRLTMHSPDLTLIPRKSSCLDAPWVVRLRSMYPKPVPPRYVVVFFSRDTCRYICVVIVLIVLWIVSFGMMENDSCDSSFAILHFTSRVVFKCWYFGRNWRMRRAWIRYRCRYRCAPYYIMT